ncbi:MAG: PKD domain-containing protein [Gaiellaceae bacterium]
MIRAVVVLIAALACAASAQAAPRWLSPVRLSPADRALSPELALNAALGAATVVWDHEEGADCPTQPASLSCIHIVEAVTRSTARSAWSAPIEVARPGIGALPRAAIDRAGDIAITWIHDIGEDRVQQATIRPAGASTWPNANDLSSSPVRIRNHGIALDLQGNAVAVWAQRDGANFYVVGDLRPAAGGAWLAPVALSSLAADSTSGPALAVVPSGDALAAWVDGGALRVAHGNAATGIWDATLTPAAGGVGTDTDVDVALNPVGDAIAAWSWRRSATGPVVVQASFRPAGGGWGAVVDLGASGSVQSRVQVEINFAGSAAVVWRDGAALKARGRARSTGAWSNAATVATNVAAGGAALAMNGVGDAVAAWPNGTTGAIRAALRPAGAAWQPPVRIGDPGSSEPRVALDGSSGAVAVWDRTSSQRVFTESADLMPNGPVLGGVQVPAHTRADEATTFGVSPRSWGGLALVGSPLWRFGDGKSASGTHVSHTYRSAGTFTVSVSQADSSAVRSTVTRTVAVSH